MFTDTCIIHIDFVDLDLTVVKTAHCNSTDDDDEDNIMIDGEPVSGLAAAAATGNNNSGMYYIHTVFTIFINYGQRWD